MRHIQSQYDVVVVGGGIAGSGIVRDASLRGLKCLLVEKKDFASGTSSKSGKLIHGGLRYLRYLNFRLVWEACNERIRLLRTVAPHLVKHTQFIIPFYEISRTPRWLTAIGLFLYELLSLFRNVKRFRLLSSKQLREYEPHIRDSDMGALTYTDCVAMDSRLVIDTLKSAVDAGACVVNYCALSQIKFESGGVGVTLDDALSGQSHQVKSRVVINAAGAWADDVLTQNNIRNVFHLKHSSGVHLVFRRDRLPVNHTLGLEAIQDHRNIYAIPFGEYVVVGTTDVFYDGDKDQVTVTSDASQYLIDSMNYYYPQAHLEFTDVVSAYAGIRPLIGQHTSQREEEVSRDYAILVDERGLVSVSGGKLTTYRSMSKKVVDTVVRRFFREKPLKTCQTLSPISGGEPVPSDQAVNSLGDRYGSNYSKVGDIIRNNPEKGQKISNTLPYLWAEIDYFVDDEFAEKLSDVLMRRTSIFLFSEDRGSSVCESVAEYMGRLKNWSREKIKHEIEEYRHETQIHF